MEVENTSRGNEGVNSIGEIIVKGGKRMTTK